MRTSKQILAINLKYYRYKSKMSQEQFAEAMHTNLIYENQLEKGRRNPSLDMVDKLAKNISKLLGYKVTSSDLILYDNNKIIHTKRVDSLKKYSIQK